MSEYGHQQGSGWVCPLVPGQGGTTLHSLNCLRTGFVVVFYCDVKDSRSKVVMTGHVKHCVNNRHISCISDQPRLISHSPGST